MSELENLKKVAIATEELFRIRDLLYRDRKIATRDQGNHQVAARADIVTRHDEVLAEKAVRSALKVWRGQ